MQLNRLPRPNRFFKILPTDWKESLIPIWNDVKNEAQVYVLEENKELLAGGIVFKAMIPEMETYQTEAMHWFSKNYAYIGYVWVPIEKRHQQYGTRWLEKLFSLNPNQHYWLTTEEKQLRQFYEKSGFRYKKTIKNEYLEEDLFIY
ncbi:MAG: GNAT family N-acetyltransferase [Flavobacteriaceae bacterium]